MSGPSPWAAGDYGPTAARLEPVARQVVDSLGELRGLRLLDVGTGTGNAALLAAEAGAEVVGADPTRELLASARRRADGAGLRCDWVEAPAEALPFPDGHFQRVVSVFGAMFAQDHHAAARELLRVAATGGRLSLTSWVPEGPLAEFAGAVAETLPPSPPGRPGPAAWGREEHVRELFEPLGARVGVVTGEVSFTAASPEAYLDQEMRTSGALLLAAERLGSSTAASLRERLRAILDAGNEARDGSLRLTSRYLVVTVEPAG